MRVLMATMQLDIGGAETHIVELSKALLKKGVEVVVASKGGAYVKELEDAGIRHFEVELSRKTPTSMYRAYKTLKKIIFEEKIDIVHAHARIPAFLCGLLHKKYKFRFVTTAHWVFNTRFPLNLLTNWGQRSLAVSDDIKQYLIDNYGCKAENIRITINGVDTKKFSESIDFEDVAAEFGFGKGKTRVVYVSRMDIDRSLAAHKLIEAVPEIYSQIPNLEVVVVGGGNDFESVKQEADSINARLGERVVIVTGGRIDINKFAAAADVFVGVSRAALEAMACKKPAIIAGNEGYIGIFNQDKLEVSIDTNFCCRGCGKTTADKLRDDLLSLLGDDKAELRAMLGEYSLATVKKYYSVDTMAQDAIKMYVSVAKGISVNEADAAELSEIERYLICGSGRRGIDVVISGYYGFHNSGDDSILNAIIADLKATCPNIKITVLSKKPDETARIYGVSSIDRFNFVKTACLLRRTKLLISGGGSLIQDVTSSKSLYYYLWVITLAKLCGAKVMLYANGIGPVSKKRNIRLVKNTLKNVDFITLREESSLDEIRNIMGSHDFCMATADPVFGAAAAAGQQIDDALRMGGIKQDDRFFVVSVREWSKMDSNAEQKICDFCESIYSRHGVKPFIIPMHSTFDKRISDRIEKILSVPHGVCLDGYTPEVMMGIIQRAEFVVGMRLHTIIYAVKMGVPAIALDYDPKVSAIMESTSLRYIQKVENIDAAKLCEFADDILKNRDALSKAICKKSEDFCLLAKKNTEIAVKLLKSK